MAIQINGWKNPKQSWIGIRCTEETFAKSFVEEGEIKFSSPQSWVDHAKENIGRGDPYEGMVACSPEYDFERLSKLRAKYPELRQDRYNGTVIFRRPADMILPCFCYYSLSSKLFKCPTTPGVHSLPFHIPTEYFSGFDDAKPAIVIFRISEFHQLLLNYLLSHGVKREEILIQKVQYFEHDSGMWIDINCLSPQELFCKTSQFRVQQEDRIVINSSKLEIQKLFENTIKIGDLRTISQYCNNAQLEKEHGLDVTMKVRVEA